MADRAFIYIPAGAYESHAARCYDYLEHKGYEFIGLVRDDWRAAVDMLYTGRADVGIVAADYLDPRRKPRFEYVSNYWVPAPHAGRNAAPLRPVHRSRLIPRDEG